MTLKMSILQEADIVAFAKEVLGLDENDKGKFSCFNKEHEDENPSMEVSEYGDRDHFHCWVCDNHAGRQSRWDVFDVCRVYLESKGEPFGFQDCLKELCEHLGLSYEKPERKLDKFEKFMIDAYAEMDKLLKMNEHRHILSYLKKRGITSPEVLRTIGIAPILPKRKAPFGREVAKWYDPMAAEGAILFPIKNSSGKIVSIKVRLARLNATGDTEKMIRTIGSGEGFFGDHKATSPVVVEGEMDALRLMEIFGTSNIISSGGAGSPMREIAKIGADTYTVIPDNDKIDPSNGVAVGYMVPHKLAKLGAFVRVCQIPMKFNDFEDFVESVGSERAIDFVSKNICPYGEFLARWRISAKNFMEFAPGKTYEDMTWSLARDLVNFMDKQSFIEKMSELSGVPLEDIKRYMRPDERHEENRLSEEIDAIREDPNMDRNVAHDAIGTMCFSHFSQYGTWIKDESMPFLVWNGDMLKVVQSDSGATFQSLLHNKTGILPVSVEGKHVISSIRMRALQCAVQVKYQPNTYADRSKSSLHIALSNAEVVKITKDSIEKVPNGSEGLLLGWPSYYSEIKYGDSFDKEYALRFLKKNLIDYIPCQSQLRPLVAGFFLCSYFRDYIHGQRAIFHITGGHGVGKTSSMSMFGHLLFGNDLNRGRVTSASLTSSASVEPLILLDNWEHHNLDESKMQFLLTSTTGSSSMKRKMNTERGITVENPNAMLMVTSIETWGNPELKSRTLNIDFKRKYRQPKLMTVSSMRDLITKNRNRVLGGLFRFFKEDILPAMAGDEWKRTLDSWSTLTERDRLDKDRILPTIALIALITKHAMEVYPEYSPHKGELGKFWIDYVYDQDKKDRRESNPFPEYIESLRILIDRQRDVGIKYIGNSMWEGTASQFVSAFQYLDKVQGKKVGFPYRTAASMEKRALHSQQEINESGLTFNQVGKYSDTGSPIWRATMPDRETEYYDERSTKKV